MSLLYHTTCLCCDRIRDIDVIDLDFALRAFFQDDILGNLFDENGFFRVDLRIQVDICEIEDRDSI